MLTLVVELVDDELTVLPDPPPALRPARRLRPRGALAPWFEIGAPLDRLDAVSPTAVAADGALILVTPDGGVAAARPGPRRFAGVRDLDTSRLDAGARRPAAPTSSCTSTASTTSSSGSATVDAQAGVLLRPATVAQIVAIAHGGERMPPKTTFFHPKPPHGVVVRLLDE